MAIRILSSADDYYAEQLASDNAANATATYVAQYLSRPDVAAYIAQNQQAFPHLTPGAALSLAQAGQGPNSPVTSAVATAAANRKVQRGFGWHSVGDIVQGPASFLGKAIGFVAPPIARGLSPIKPATRIAFAAFDSAAQYPSAIVRQQARDIHDFGIIGGLLHRQNPVDLLSNRQAFEQTTVAQVLPTSVGGSSQSLGQGFFVGQSPAAKAQATKARTVYEIDGKAGTMGRLLAHQVAEPGSWQYNALSGTLDGAAAWFLDPGAAALTSASKARAASRLLTPGTELAESGTTAARIVALTSNPDEAARVAGLISTAPRRTVEDVTALNYATHGAGQRFIQWATDNDSAYDIWTKLGGPRGKLPLTVARDLATSQSDAETLAVFNNHYLSGVIRDKPFTASLVTSIIKPIGGWTASIRQSPDSIRLFASFPRDLSVSSNHVDDLAVKLRAQLQNARLGKGAIEHHINRLAYALPEERLQVVDDAMADVASRIAGQVDASGNILGGKVLKPGDKVYSAGRAVSGRVLDIADRPSMYFDDEAPGEFYRFTAAEMAEATKAEESGVRSATRGFIADKLEEGWKYKKNADGSTTVYKGEPLTYAEKTARVEFNVDGQIVHEDLPVDALSVRLPYTKARQMSRVDMGAIRQPFLDEIADNTPVLGGIVGGTPIDLPHPHILAEAAGPTTGYLPDLRELRSQFSTLGHILNDQRISWAPDLLDKFRKVWLPATLLRASGSIRSVMSEQAVMAAQGYTSLLRHPISHIATIVGKRGGTSITGSLLSDAEELQTAMQFSGKGWIDRMVKAGSEVLTPAHPQYAAKWADRLTSLSRDPLAAKIAGNWDDATDFTRTGNNVLDAKSWFKQVRVPQLREGIDSTHWSDILKSESAADKYVDDLATQVQHYTQSDAALTEVIARGTLGGNPALIPTSGNASLSDELTAYMRGMTDRGQHPPWVGAARDLTESQRKGLNGAVDKMFHMLWQVPMERLTLIPLFKQLYWERAGEVLPLLTKEAQAEVLRNAAEAGFKRPELRAMAGRVLKGNGALSVEEAHVLGMDHAINKSRDMLYDLHNRSQFGDISRHFFPFFDAWKYNIEQAAKIGVQHPESIRRFQMAVEGARGSGFFHINGDGKEVFTFPGSEFVSRNIPFGPHASIPLESPTAGLNMVANQILPGLGPVVQIPLGHILPDKPDFEWIRRVTMPYGERGLGSTLMPPWADRIWKRVSSDENSDRDFSNSVMYSARYLMSSGNYDLSNPADKSRLHDAAVNMAKGVWFVRGLGTWLGPSSPAPEWRAQDKDGHFLALWKMSEAFKKMQANPEIGEDNAVAAFLSTFGEKNILALQSFTVGTQPQSQADYDWERENPDVVVDYPDAYTYFAPQDARKAPFESYLRAIDKGQRRQLTFNEWVTRANDRVGSMIYYNQKDLLGPSPFRNQLDWLVKLRDHLKQQYPGFDPEAADPSRTARTIEQLYQAANTGILASTPAGRAIAQYLNLRDQAMASASAAGLRSGFSTAKKAAPIRAWLSQNAARIQSQSPQFSRVWEQVFAREVNSG